ncbi:MAG: hypothetical protein ABI806_29440 [Candidatus Solibacter sp.]
MKLLLSLLLAVAASFGAVGYAGSNMCGSGSGTIIPPAAQTCTYTVIGTGNVLLVTATSPHAGTTFTISDTVNTYVSVDSGVAAVTSFNVWKVVSLVASGSITVSVTPSTTDEVTVGITEISGSPAGVVNAHNATSSITGTVSGTKNYQCGSITTTLADSFIYVAGMIGNFNNNVTTIVSGLATTDASLTAVGNRLTIGHTLATTTGTYSPIFTCTPSGNCQTTGNTCVLVAIGGAAASTRIRHSSRGGN